MRSARIVRGCIVGLAILVGLSGGPLRAADGDQRSVRQANARFYVAINALFTGDVAPMKQIWSHADDVTYMGAAGGFQVGWDQVLGNWEAQAALKLGGKIGPQDIRINVGRDLAVVHCMEMGENTNAAGKPRKVSIRATNLYRKENGHWKMIGHHTDLLPFLQK